jgi:hypothetical protein
MEVDGGTVDSGKRNQTARPARGHLEDQRLRFGVGQRVRQKLSGEVGVVLGVQNANGVAAQYDVSFATGVWQLPGTALSPVYADPFDVLKSNGGPLYPYDGWLRRESLRLRRRLSQ